MFGIDDAALAIGGSAVISGLLGSDASRSSANTMADASDRASQTTMAQYRTTRNDLAPYRDAGGEALKRLMYLTGVGGKTRSPYAGPLVDVSSGTPAPMMNLYGSDPAYKKAWEEVLASHRQTQGVDFQSSTPSDAIERHLRALLPTGTTAPQEGSDEEYGSLMKDFTLDDFQKDPGYAFRQSEGEKALERGAAARGLSASTPGLKSLMRFNQDLASTEFGAAYGRDAANKSNKFNLLSYLSGGGQNAAAMTGTAGTNAAAGASQAIMAGGAAAGQGIMGQAGAWNNAIQGGLGNLMYQQRYNELMKRMPVFTAPGGGAIDWNATGDFGGVSNG